MKTTEKVSPEFPEYIKSIGGFEKLVEWGLR